MLLGHLQLGITLNGVAMILYRYGGYTEHVMASYASLQ